MNIKQYEKKVNSNKNRNTRFVNIRSQHCCKSCGIILNIGTKCLTTNKQGVGRHWYCMNCVKQMIQYKNSNDNVNRNCSTYRCIVSTISDLNNLAFGDEGGALANMEALSEYEEKCLDCGKCAFAEMLCNN